MTCINYLFIFANINTKMKRFITILVFVTVTINLFAPVTKRTDRQKDFIIYCQSSAFDFELLKDLVRYTCEHPYHVLSQAILETGNFKSKAFRNHNNLFGMKYNSRGYAQKSDSLIYATYDHWTASVFDYAEWQKQRYKGGNYLNFLDSIPIGDNYYRYAQDPHYRNKLIKILETWD